MSATTAPVPSSEADDRPAARHAVLVAAGILLSRVIGLVRQRVFAHYFGTTPEADAFSFAFRLPNFLQNLFGEGVLSASFIPVYASLIARGDRDEARRVAGGILALLSLVMSVFVLGGVLLAPVLVALLAPGFSGETRDLTIRLVRVFFPGAALLALSAWCLGILNSHRRFFLSYAAPVVWNLTIIVALLSFGGVRTLPQLALIGAWASVAGSALQLAVQLPVVIALVGRLRVRVERGAATVREVVRNFFPVFVGRGVVQISAYVDNFIATLLVSGSVAALNYAQVLYMLPVSLFGMAVSAAELPAMSSAVGAREEIASRLRARLEGGIRRIAFWIVPSAVAFLALGDVIAGAIYQSGHFTGSQARWVWGILAGYSVGLLASTLGRLYASALYALRDTRAPLRASMVRVGLNVALGFALAIPVRRALGLDEIWGAAGLTLASGLAAWVEFVLLRRFVAARVGALGAGASALLPLFAAGVVAALGAWGVRAILAGHGPLVVAGLVLASYGLVYFGATSALGVAESRSILRRVIGRLGINPNR